MWSDPAAVLWPVIPPDSVVNKGLETTRQSPAIEMDISAEEFREVWKEL